MGYKFIRDIHIKYPFYKRKAEKLEGVKSNKTREGKEI